MYIFFKNEGKDDCIYFDSQDKVDSFVASTTYSVFLSDEEFKNLGVSPALVVVDYSAKTVTVDQSKVDERDLENKAEEARQYLASTDFYFTIDKYATLSEERKAELEAKRALARETVNLIEGA